MYAIETFNLTKRYGSITAVDHLNLKVKRGEIFGYLGHNGSGKTTTIMMLGREEGKTIFLSSHLLAEVKQLCDRVGILKRGKLIALGSVRELARQLNQEKLVTVVLEVNKEVSKENGKVTIKAEEGIRKDIFRTISSFGLEIISLRLVEPSLDDVFLKTYEVG